MKRKKRNQNRRGSAIILCLAVLSLMLILAMVFAFDARASSVAASNHSKIIKARLLNESGISRAIAVVDTLFSDGSDMHLDCTFLSPGVRFQSGGKVAGTDWDGSRYMFSYAATVSNSGLDDAMEFKIPTGDDDPVGFLPKHQAGSLLHDNFSWLNIKTLSDNTTDGTGTVTGGTVSDSVIGRIAYVIVDGTGKIDPTFPSQTTGTRVGLSGSEIGFDEITGLTGGLSYATTSDTWLYLSDFYRGAKATSLIADGYTLRNSLCFSTIADSEVFWMDANNDSECDEANEIHDRVNLSDIGGSISAVELYKFLITSDPNGTVDASADTSKSPWLRYCKGDYFSGATDLSLAWHRAAAQLAVNMIDYADGDAIPTVATINKATKAISVLPAGTFPTSAPANTESVVYGVESGYSLDELVVKIEGKNYVGPAPGPESVVVGLEFKCNLANPMGVAASAGTIEIRYSFTVNGVTSADTTEVIPLTGATQTSVTSTIADTPFALAGAGYTIDRVDIKSIEIKDNAATPNVLWRYPVFADGASSVATQFCQFVDLTGTSYTADKALYAHMEATEDALFTRLDPHDLNSQSSWTLYDHATWNPVSPRQQVGLVATAPTAYPRSANTLYDAQEYCEAKCPNAAFQRVGELGRIHHPYRKNRSVRFWINDNADGTWQDAYLLDMFKVGSDSTKSGIVSINGASVGAYNALFSGIGLGGTGNPVTSLLALNGGTAGNPFMFRGEIYKIFAGNDLVQDATAPLLADKFADVDAENAIGKVIELLTTRQNYFTICVTSQSLRDIGTQDLTGSNTKCVEYESGKFALIDSTAKTITSVYRDAWKKKSKVLRTEVIEDL